MLNYRMIVKDGRVVAKDSIEEQIDKVTEGMDYASVALVKLFASDKKIKDHGDFHSLAEELGVESSVLEERAYQLIQSFFSKGRYMEEGKGVDIDIRQLEAGTKVEMEHTNNPVIARRIALDHLIELPDYYSRLAVMEKQK